MTRLIILSIYTLLFALAGCNHEKSFFSFIEPDQSNVYFNNLIEESDSLNILTNQYLYNGGGVGVGDFNNDKLPDLYFTGNLVPNRMYLNRGDFKFEDITEFSGTACSDIWSSGISVVDINADGWDDLYISATFYDDSLKRQNRLFINRHLNEKGLPVFEEMAKSYGLDDRGHTTHTVFLDYDLDGDLDAYLLTNKLLLRRSASIQDRIIDGSSVTTDKLYRNDGNNHFINVSEEAGITIEGFGLGVSILDVNQDYYPDIYVSNDFVTNDVLYVNQQDGTFLNQIGDYVTQQSFSSMGIDVGDINNDGFDDIMTLDMQPEDEERFKKMFGANQYQYFDIMESRGYESQVYRNSFQLNNGNQGFSEISQLLGMHATDWSWSILFADFDNDTRNDIAITNGFPRDITDLDFINYRSGANRMLSINKAMLDQIPQVKIKNYFYRNTGELNVVDVSEEWGIEKESFSNGAVYADLDLDGDLDYAVNNINDPAHLYRNNLHNTTHFLRVKLKCQNQNIQGLGSRITVWSGDIRQEKTHNPYRGYISSVENTLHFGLGDMEEIDSVVVIWPDRSRQLVLQPMINSTIIIEKSHPQSIASGTDKKIKTWFSEPDQNHSLDFKHQDVTFFDFNIQKLLPHMHSNEGPGIAIGDINGDGLEDAVFGNGRSFPVYNFIASADGYIAKEIPGSKDSEKLGMLLFDMDNDLDLDLYICAGSSEFEDGHSLLKDLLCENDGQGNFLPRPGNLPELTTSTSSVSAADFDKDGDLDLFVTGRIKPQSYPMPVSSHILRNDNGIFSDVTTQICPVMHELGMATSGIWTDIDNDHWIDLIVVGEWMPVTVFRNNGGHLTNITETVGLGDTQGWWNTVSGADLNGDGYTDYILGNQGLNNRINPTKDQPIIVVAKDFDNNGSVDNLHFGYVEGRLVPLHLLKDLKGQLLEMRKKFQRFSDYAGATIDEVLTESQLEGSYRAEVKMFESGVLINRQGKFDWKVLPVEAQFAPVYGIVAEDFNADGFLDLAIAGNRYSTERTTGKHNASIGLVLEGRDGASFSALSPVESGFLVKGDSKALVKFVSASGNPGLVVSRNNDQIKMFELNVGNYNFQLMRPPPSSAYAMIKHRDGRTEKREIYFGSGYASSGSNAILIHEGIETVNFYNLDGDLLVSEL